MEAPVCPSCGHALTKTPSRKSKCRWCGEFIYSRTRPSDRHKVLVTKVGADEIEADWELYRATAAVRDTNRPGFEKEKAELSQKFGGTPRDTDIIWGLLVKERLVHNSRKEWGLFRNTTLDMALLLLSERRDREALLHYLDVAYMDVLMDQELRSELAEEGEELGFADSVASGIVETIVVLYKRVGLTMPKLQEAFMQRASILQRLTSAAPKPEGAWLVLARSIIATQ